jgi:hypothetical protein
LRIVVVHFDVAMVGIALTFVEADFMGLLTTG